MFGASLWIRRKARRISHRDIKITDACFCLVCISIKGQISSPTRLLYAKALYGVERFWFYIEWRVFWFWWRVFWFFGAYVWIFRVVFIEFYSRNDKHIPALYVAAKTSRCFIIWCLIFGGCQYWFLLLSGVLYLSRSIFLRVLSAFAVFCCFEVFLSWQVGCFCACFVLRACKQILGACFAVYLFYITEGVILYIF